jgi:alpha-mannosidase
MPGIGFPPSPFLQLIPNRAEAALRRLRDLVWRDRRPIRVYATRSTAAHRTLGEVKHERLRDVAIDSAWGRLFDQRWCKLELGSDIGEAPAARTRSQRGFRATDQKPAAGAVSQGGGTPPTGIDKPFLEWRDQGEATLYVDGRPYYGFDVAHRFVALPEDAREFWVECYCCQSAIWHPDATGLSSRGSVFGGAFLVKRDEQVWAALHDLQGLFDVMMHLRAQQLPKPPEQLARFGQQPSVEQVTPAYRILLSRLSDALDVFDAKGVSALREALGKIYHEFRDARSLVRAVLTGHAHIDLVWLWPERMGEAKAVHTFASMNRMMELYPEFRFAYSQPASYRAVERRAPELAAAVAERVRSGQWQPTGALDVESDTLLPCGEALARSFLLGQREFTRLRGAPSRLLWLPDVFGYSGCLPQLMKLSRVDWFFTTKLTWSAINRFPYSSFVWRGVDGSEVVAHVTQNVGYNNRLAIDELQANAAGHVQADVHPEFLHPTGYGDGGGGPTEEMCERARRLSALAGMPALSWEQPEAFFARLEARRSQLPVYQGECYLEYHRGTYTTHGDFKSAFRGLERALQAREATAVVRRSAPDLTAEWRRAVFAQFHDYIPGSSIAEVYATGGSELKQLAERLYRDATKELETAGDGAEERIFNPLPQRWAGWVATALHERKTWFDLPPLASVRVADPAPPPQPARIRNRVLWNEYVHAEVNAQGALTVLRLDGTEIQWAGPAARAMLYPDRPSNYDAWDIDRHSLALGTPVSTRVIFRVETTSDDRVAIAVTRKLGKASSMTLRYVLHAGEKVLRLELAIDWHEEHTLLKLHFPTGYRGVSARFGAPFGSVLRGQQPGRTADEAQWEVPGSRWAAVCNDGERQGLALITEAKYGFSAREGDLSVSLLRSARITGCDDHRYASPRELSRYQSASPFTDQGSHLIRLALSAYDGGGEKSPPPASLAETLFASPLMFRGVASSAGFRGIHGAPTLTPAWAMPLDAVSWVLRLHEVGGQRGEAKIELETGWSARRCGLDGAVDPIEAITTTVSFRPYEIVSVRIERTAG